MHYTRIRQSGYWLDVLPASHFHNNSLRYHKNSKNDAKWGLLYEFSRIIEECQPEVVSMENVPGLRNKDIFRKFVSRLKKLHYNVDYSVVYCPDYGVPQKRKRLVLLASKLGVIKLIPPLYTADKYVTVRDAIGSLPPIGDGEICQSDFLHCSCKLSAINKKRIKQSVPGGDMERLESGITSFLPSERQREVICFGLWKDVLG